MLAFLTKTGMAYEYTRKHWDVSTVLKTQEQSHWFLKQNEWRTFLYTSKSKTLLCGFTLSCILIGRKSSIIVNTRITGHMKVDLFFNFWPHFCRVTRTRFAAYSRNIFVQLISVPYAISKLL